MGGNKPWMLFNTNISFHELSWQAVQASCPGNQGLQCLQVERQLQQPAPGTCSCLWHAVAHDPNRRLQDNAMACGTRLHHSNRRFQETAIASGMQVPVPCPPVHLEVQICKQHGHDCLQKEGPNGGPLEGQRETCKTGARNKPAA
eukprot:873480-Pelagomonas_calceolata.AAC.6